MTGGLKIFSGVTFGRGASLAVIKPYPALADAGPPLKGSTRNRVAAVGSMKINTRFPRIGQLNNEGSFCVSFSLQWPAKWVVLTLRLAVPVLARASGNHVRLWLRLTNVLALTIAARYCILLIHTTLIFP